MTHQFYHFDPPLSRKSDLSLQQVNSSQFDESFTLEYWLENLRTKGIESIRYTSDDFKFILQEATVQPLFSRISIQLPSWLHGTAQLAVCLDEIQKKKTYLLAVPRTILGKTKTVTVYSWQVSVSV